MIDGSLEPVDRLSVSLPLGCDPTGCGFKDPRTHKRHLVSLFRYPVFRERLSLVRAGRGRRGVGDLFPLTLLVKFFLAEIFRPRRSQDSHLAPTAPP